MAHMTLKMWYGTSVHIPRYSNPYFISFVSSCIGIVRSVVARDTKKEIRVQFCRIPTAAADQDNHLILLNEQFLVGEFGGGIHLHDSADGISAILGLIVHEAAHFAWSPKTLVPFSDYVKAHTPHFFHESLAMMLGNVVEDIFIEAQVDKVIPRISWMLDETNRIFFSSDEKQKRTKGVAQVKEAPKVKEELEAIVDALIMAKIQDSIIGTPWMKDMFHRARSATQMGRIEDRFDLTLDLYNRLMENMKASAMDALKLNAGSPVPDAKGKPAPKQEDRRFMKPLSVLGDKTNEILEKLDNADIELRHSDIPGDPNHPVVFIESTFKPTAMAVTVDARYQVLAEIARQRATVNRPYGLDMERGHHMRKLYRIGTDQKIFAEPRPTQSFKPMEVAILIDCSGSMAGYNMEAAMSAAAGAAIALTEARCNVGVFGHTSDVYGNDVLVYNFKDFDGPIEGLANRLWAMKVDGRSQKNRDGDAIEHVGKKFTASNRRQLMIVISDGKPNSEGGYEGTFAIEHTKKRVNDLRQRGIKVLSISINDTAAKVNNVIYGPENNVFNSDVNVIANIIQDMLTA